MYVDMRFTQNMGAFNREFSFEEQGLLPMYIVFSVLWTLLVVPVFYSGYVLWRKGQYVLVRATRSCV